MTKTILAALLALAPALAAQEPRSFRMSVAGAKEASVTEKDVSSCSLEKRDGRNAVTLQLSPEGAAKIQRLTGQNVGKRMGIFIAGRKVQEPEIGAKITGSRVTFTELTDSMILDLVRALLARR